MQNIKYYIFFKCASFFTDRKMLFEEDGNLFHDQRVKERLRMPDLQAGLLMYGFIFTQKKSLLLNRFFL